MAGQIDKLTGLTEKEAYEKRTRVGFYIREVLIDSVLEAQNAGGERAIIGDLMETMVNDASTLHREERRRSARISQAPTER